MSESATPANRRERFPIAVVLERRVAKSTWADHTWEASGITVGRHPRTDEPRLIREDSGTAFFIVGGLQVELFADECESYYFNLVSETPRAYVLAHLADADSAPEPFRITLSFDEAHAYLEGEDEIYAVDVPPELYLWAEAFVIANYFPEKKRKRKLRDWTADDSAVEQR